MRKAEIRERFDEVVNFAGIGEFLDTPVKRYSSGMYVRLAFSIAAHIEPEILIVDEVLAVGDVAFQKKCLGKMAEACNRARTTLFVSHNLAAVENLCNRGIVLQHGSLVFAGKTKDAIEYYLTNIGEEGSNTKSYAVDLSTASGRVTKYRPALQRLELFNLDGSPLTGGLPIGKGVRAIVHFNLERRCTSFDVSVAFDTPSGQRLCTAHSAYEPERIHEERIGPQVFTCEITNLTLLPGEYKVGVGLDIAGSEVDWVDGATRLKILKSDFYNTGIIPTKGAFLVPNRWSLAAGQCEEEEEQVPA
jgi:lipopolysaccharide transport system ATP-binding protein